VTTAILSALRADSPPFLMRSPLACRLAAAVYALRKRVFEKKCVYLSSPLSLELLFCFISSGFIC
jgi:hypothetical protein